MKIEIKYQKVNSGYSPYVEEEIHSPKVKSKIIALSLTFAR